MLALAGGTSPGFSGTLSTNPTIKQQQLICDPDEPAAGSTSVDYNANLVRLIGVEGGPGYARNLAGSVEVMDRFGRRILQDLSDFLRFPAGTETGYVQVRYGLSGEPGQMSPPQGQGWKVADDRGVVGVDTHALYFEVRDEYREDVEYGYRIYAAEAGAHSNPEADGLTLNDGTGRRLGPKDLAPVTLSTLPRAEPITINGSAGDDRLVITATGRDTGVWSLNGGPGMRFLASSLNFTGGGGNDSLEIHNPAGGLFAPASGIDYHGGGQGGDAVAILGGAAGNGFYQVGPTPDAGVIGHAGPAGDLILRFTGLAPATDTVAEANFTVTATDAANAVTIDNGTAVGDGMLRVMVDSFEPVQFANKSNVTVRAGVSAADGNDIITLAYTEVATGLTSVNIDGGGGGDVILVSQTAARTNVDAGEGIDSVSFGNGVTLNGGTVSGGGDGDTLTYEAWTTPVAVNLGSNAPGLAATLQGEQELPSQATTATGTATLTYNSVSRLFDISVSVSNLNPSQVTGFHIHRATVNFNGPIIVDFAPGGVPIAPLVPSGTGFTFNATGIFLGAANEAALLGGATYVNVHTAAAPGGLIRGQLFPTGLFVAAPGTATGTGGVSGFEHVFGSAAADSLVGDLGSNTILGVGGNDTIVGSRGNDTLNGGADNDLIAWSNGDGTDLVDGDAGLLDFAQINGAPTAANSFSVAAGPGGRIDLDRLSPAPFSLDIGTIEQLTVVGGAADDTFTVGSLAGVTSVRLSLNGFDGSDTFDITPANINIDAYGWVPGPPASPGDRVNVNVAGTTNPRLSRNSSATGYTGSYQFDDRSPVSFIQVETLTPSVTDLSVTKTDGRTTTHSGAATTYTIVVTNNGPLGVSAGLVDNFPAALTGVSWSRTLAGGASAPSADSGTGNINHLLILPIGSSATYVVTATVSPSATGTVSNTATVTSLAGADTNPANNSATDTTLIDNTPVANLDLFGTVEDTPLTVPAPGVLANDTDPNGDALTAVSLDTSASIGTFVLRADGSLTYTPPPNFHGTDSAHYRASDGVAPGLPGFILVNVTQVDDRPVASDDAYATDEDTPLAVAAPGVLANDTDPDGGLMQVMSFTQPANGSVSLLPGGGFVYTPNPNFRGNDSFTYVARDPSNATDGATVAITVRPVEDPPAAANDAYSVAAGGSLNVPAATGVLANDSDADGDALTAVLVSGPAHGALTLNPNGSFTYSPAAGFSGADSFLYRTSDGDQSSLPASVSINVTTVAPRPSLTINDVAVTERTGGTTNAVFTVTLSANPAGVVTVNFATAPAGLDAATAGADYTHVTGMLTFNPGAPLTQTISVPVVGDTTAEPPETFVVNLSGATNATVADGVGVGTIDDDDSLPPRVTQVFVAGSAWSAAFKSFLASRGVGDAAFGFAVPAGAGQLDELPWVNLNQLSFRFDQPVLALDPDLAVYGVNVPGYAVSGFDYDEATNTATWTLAAAPSTDKLLLDLDGGAGGVVNGAAVRLDGDWSNDGSDSYPSGDGAAGGDLRFRLNVLAGDVNRDGRINALDWFELLRRRHRTAASPGTGPLQYLVFHDVNGDGTIGIPDLLAVRRNLLGRLPPTEPAPPAAAGSVAGLPAGGSVADELFGGAPIL